MSSSRSTIDEALSPDNLEELSELMFSEEKPQGKSNREQLSAQNISQNAGSKETADVDPSHPKDTGHSKLSDTEKQEQGDSHQNRGAANHSQKSSAQEPLSRPSQSNLPRPSVKCQPKRRRASERPTFTIGADQMATLRVAGSSRTDPLGSSASEIARRLFDLFGYNGRHPAAALHGMALSDNAPASGPLIEERQWKDLLAKADEMVACLAHPSEESLAEMSLDGDSLGVESFDEGEARLACVSFLVQEALYEAGFGDRRRRRKGPF